MIDDLESRLDNVTKSGDFSFGFNWLDFVNKRMTDAVVETHLVDLRKLYNTLDIDRSRRVLDLGCGSGLSSLCFRLMGFTDVKSVDIDPFSIEASTLLMRKYAHLTSGDWVAEVADITNEVFVSSHTNTFGVVYSWGVLHHTGNVWLSIKNAASLVEEEGVLHISLYRSGDLYTQHLLQKAGYRLADKHGKKRILLSYLKLIEEVTGKDVFEPKDHRGMNHFTDALDWLGGLPYEVVDPDVLQAYMRSLGFSRLIFGDNVQGGPFLDIYKRTTVSREPR